MMRNWLVGLAAGTGLLLASWGMLILLAKRLPPGMARDLAAFIPDCATTVRRLRKDPRVPRRAKIAIVFAGLWVASPIDLIPEFIPVIGPLDDIIVVALALRYAGRQVLRDVLLAAWPGDPQLMQRLLGPPRSNGQTSGAPGPDELRVAVQEAGTPILASRRRIRRSICRGSAAPAPHPVRRGRRDPGSQAPVH